MPTINNLFRARGIKGLTAQDADLLPFADSLLCVSAGTAVITDLNGAITTIPLLAGQTLHVGVQRLALASTGTYFGLYE